MIKILNTSKYFTTIATALCNLINRTYQGIDCELVYDINLNSEDIYIIFDIKTMENTPKKYIVYNFEQLEVIDIEELFWNNIRKAQMIIDYSQSNIAFLKQHNIDAKFLPLCWNRHMKIQNNTKFIDRRNNIMFIGYFNERRRDILKPIHSLCKERNYNMFLSNKCWEEEYKHMLSITKVALNIHCYKGKTILEVHRIIPYILNKIWVISERSNDEYYDTQFDDLVTWSDSENFAEHFSTIMDMNKEDIETELLSRQRKLIEKCSYNNEMMEKLNISSFI